MTDEPNEYVDFVEVYQDEGGEWRWRGLAANNQVVSTSGEGFQAEDYARSAAMLAHPKARLRNELPDG